MKGMGNKIKFDKRSLDEFWWKDKETLKRIEKQMLNYLFAQNKFQKLSKDDVREVGQTAMYLLILNATNGKIRLESDPVTYTIGIAKRLLIKCASESKRTISIEDTDLLRTLAAEENNDIERNELSWRIYYRAYKKLSDDCRTLIRFSKKKVKPEVLMHKLNYSSVGFVRNKLYRCKSYFIELVKKDPEKYKISGYDREDFSIFR